MTYVLSLLLAITSLLMVVTLSTYLCDYDQSQDDDDNVVLQTYNDNDPAYPHTVYNCYFLTVQLFRSRVMQCVIEKIVVG